jgi:UDP-GlcNAc:undecaprenyl-phosphate GlcNAc-1-phosphate transferase
MHTPLFLGIASFALALILTPLVRNLVGALGWFDLPDDRRKVHNRPIPRLGGIPILLACGIPFTLLTAWELARSGPSVETLQMAWRLGPAVLIVFGTGLVDDLTGLKPWQKLVSQFAAASLVCSAGLSFGSVGGHPLPAWLGIPLTLLWLAACANAFNLIDGIDGLAAGSALLASLAILAAALMLGHAGLAFVAAALAGALLGFLRCNSHPASIFLGDCGSLTIGFLLGCCAVAWENGSATLPAAAAPVMALSVPLLDMTLAVVRRVLRRRPVFRADRDHVHHRLLNRGFSPRRAVLVLYSAGAVAAAFALLECFGVYPWSGVTLAAFCAAAWLGVRRLGYIELGVAGRLVAPARLLRAAEAQIRLRALEDALVRATTADQCWDAVCCACRDLGFARAGMRLDGAVRETWLRRPGSFAASWTLRIPLSPSDYVNVGDGLGSAVEPSVVGPLASVLRRCLEPKLGRIGVQRAPLPQDYPGLDAPRIPAVSVPLC